MSGGGELKRIWPDVQELACQLIMVTREYGTGDPRIVALALSLALASVMAGLSSSEKTLRDGLKLNADFLEEYAKFFHRDIHGPMQ